jgi:hypothetical protein
MATVFDNYTAYIVLFCDEGATFNFYIIHSKLLIN